MKTKRTLVIESLGTYLPERSMSTEEVLDGCRKTIRFPLEKITGISRRPVSGEGEYSIDLAHRAVADCLARSKYAPSDIDLLLCCNISRYDGPKMFSFEPSTSARLRKAFGFSRALTFDITNACAGIFTGVYILDGLVKAGAIRRGLVVSGEYITNLTESAQREIEDFMDARLACLTLGDAGAALILEEAAAEGVGFQAIDLRTFARYSPLCIAKASEEEGMIMFTDSVNLTDAAVQRGARHALDVLERTGWAPESMDHLIMHQTSKMSLNSACRAINDLLGQKVCHANNTVYNLNDRGNTASTSHIIALSDLLRQHQLQAGERIVFNISASGLTVGMALYVMDDLPERMRSGAALESQQEQPVSAGLDRGPAGTPLPAARVESIGTLPNPSAGRRPTLDLLVEAANDCLGQSKYEANDIDLLLHCGVYRTDFTLEPAYATLLAGELHMNDDFVDEATTRTLAFDIINGAVGFLNACFVAQQLIAAQQIKTAMVVAGECENNADNYPHQPVRVGIRETATAVILDADGSGDRGLSHFRFFHDEAALQAYTTYCTFDGCPPFLQVEKAEHLHALYTECLTTAVREFLHAEDLRPDQVDLVFPPQIDTSFIGSLKKDLGLDHALWVVVAGEGPDLFTSGLPYALRHALDHGLAKPGDLGLCLAVGSGLQVGCCLYTF